jgi:hypothetical protein
MSRQKPIHPWKYPNPEHDNLIINPYGCGVKKKAFLVTIFLVDSLP